MLTAGVDLAADPAGTAVATIAWSGTAATVRLVTVPADDDVIIALAGEAVKIGVDCPLGWPDEFVAFVSAHRAGAVPIPEGVDAKQWRRRLAWRHTDEVARRLTGLVPLSVSADRIGHTAMRCAALQTRLAQAGRSVDRSGAGAVVEVYPAGSLKVWGLPWRGYKTARNQDTLGIVVDRLKQAAPWLDLGEHEELCRRSDHALDAVVAALTARAAVRDQVCRPGERELPAARTEGWIAIPTAALADLPTQSAARLSGCATSAGGLGWAPMTLSHDVAGDGPTVVLLHSTVCDRRMWDPQVPVLAAAGYRVVRCDFRGFGDSPVPDRPTSDADDVVELMDSLGAEQVALVGASGGGRVALEIAAGRPQRVTALALLCTAWSGHAPSAELRAFWAREDALHSEGDVAGATELNVDLWVGPAADQAAREQVRRMQRHAFDVQLAAVEEFPPLRTEPDLAAITARTLLVSGAHDVIDFRETAAELADRIGDARHVELDWAGHLPSLERPDAVNPLLLDFLRGA